MKRVLTTAAIAILCIAPCPAQPPLKATIDVEAGITEGRFKPIYNWFGYDEPNYTYGQFGPKLLRELSSLAPVPVYIRTHNLLTSGNGEPALKWGSTNVYTEDANGKAVYDWTILDRILDTYRDTNTRPMFEIGFMPEALSIKPQPYQHTWPRGGITAGWSYPPKDYAKWEELNYALVRHAMERYGKANVETWYWEVWNEPDIGYWKGTPEEYFKVYDHAVRGVRRALPGAKVGGPATTGPASAKAADFLRAFLEHCAQTKAPLDYISFHAKGRPRVVDGHVQMGLDKELADVAKGLDIVSAFPQYRNLPIILSEADPEGCAACSARTHPENAYRNGPLYASYTAAALKGILDLAERNHANIEGLLTWAFEFEGQPFFDGFRTLATNGVDKPVLNVFRMFGLMHGDRIRVARAGDQRVDAMATRSANSAAVLLWNYDADDVPGPDADVDLKISGLPAAAGRVEARHYRIDGRHSNAYAVWKEMGSPQELSTEQRARLESSGQLQLLTSPAWISPEGDRLHLHFTLPHQGVSLVELIWR